MSCFALSEGPEANLTTRRAVQLSEIEVAIRAVWNHRLTGLKTELGAIEMHSDDVRFERHEIRDAAHFTIGVGIRPCCLTRVANRLVAAKSRVRAECLEFHRREGGLIDVVAWNVPARREAGFVEGQWPLRIGDDPVALADHEIAGGLANVDAVVRVGRMAENSLVFFVKRVHGAPSERDAPLHFARVSWQAGVLPRPSRHDVLLVRSHAIPGGEPKIRVLGRMLGAFQRIWGYVGLRKVSYRIAARFEQQDDILAFGDPTSSQAHPHPPAQALNVQKPRRQ